MTDIESRARQLYREIEATDQRDAEEMIRRALEEVVEACAVKADDWMSSGCFSYSTGGCTECAGYTARREIAAAIRGRKQ